MMIIVMFGNTVIIITITIMFGNIVVITIMFGNTVPTRQP